MTSATRPLETLLPRARAYNQPRPRAVPGVLRRTATVIGDLCGAVGIVLCIPLVILAVEMPIALCAQLWSWIAGLL
jgi:hypothetical protein